MQNFHQTVPSAPNPHSEPFDTRPYSGLANQVETDELLYALHELTMLTGEVMPILSQIIAQIAETPTHNTN